MTDLEIYSRLVVKFNSANGNVGLIKNWLTNANAQFPVASYSYRVNNNLNVADVREELNYTLDNGWSLAVWINGAAAALATCRPVYAGQALFWNSFQSPTDGVFLRPMDPNGENLMNPRPGPRP